MSPTHNSSAPQSRKVVAFDAACSNFEDWHPNFQRLRKESPICWSQAHGGYWIVSSYQDVQRIARDWETFSSAKQWDPATGKAEGGTVIPVSPTPPLIPIESDPPQWKKYRDVMNPLLGPKAAESYRGIAAEVAAALMDRVVEKGSFDIVTDFVAPVPALVIMHILGLKYDPKHWSRWANPFHELAYLERESPEFVRSCADMEWVCQQISEQVVECRRSPRDGVLSALANAKSGDDLLNEDEVVGLATIILGGGVGTTTALTANTLLYLYRNPEARRRLRDNPELLPVAREEFVRFFSPVSSDARRVTKEVEVGGQSMSPGEFVLLAFSSANRDEKVFEQPDQLILDRSPNPHMGFGNGIHRCVGSFLARVFFNAMFNEIMTRIPDYVVAENEARRYPMTTYVNGWMTMPATFTPGTIVGTPLGQ